MKISDLEILENNVKSAPDNLVAEGNVSTRDIKNIFDKLPELIASKHNEFVDYVDESIYTKQEVDSAINQKVFETGSADMNKAVYDKNNSGVVDDSERLGGKTADKYMDKTQYDTNNSGVVDNAEMVNGFWFDFFDGDGNSSDEPYIHWGGAPVIEGTAEEAQF